MSGLIPANMKPVAKAVVAVVLTLVSLGVSLAFFDQDTGTRSSRP